ncbi:MAG: TIGR01777 family oxidoreductase [Rikenellaceae bacterium]
MKIAICGADGFIGSHLTEHLTKHNNQIFAIKRHHLLQEMVHGIHTDLQAIIEECSVIINLAGETIDQRWSAAAKQRIIESRVQTTRTIVAAINRTKTPKLLINTSAVGIYPSEGCHNDYSRAKSRSFLTQVCRAWEKEATRLDPKHDLAITRFAVVLDKNGGALPKILSTAKFGFLAQIGSPQRNFAWVDREDLVRAIAHIINHNDLRGTINICAPEQTTQQNLLNAAKKQLLQVKIVIPIPQFIIKLIRGEAATLILKGECVVPEKLLKSGFTFLSQGIESFFERY